MDDSTQGAPTSGELLNAALEYAAAGLKIYPVFIPGLKPDGKKNVRVPIRSWAEQATSDQDQVARWWGEEFPGAGIGVDMGRSELAVIDADVKDHVDGIERMIDEFGMPAVVSRTPSGGLHGWFRNDGSVGSGSNVLGDKDNPSGVDVRGVGGTIFMPPTYVPGYGRYEWITEHPPVWNGDIPPAPPRLAAICPPGGRRREAAVHDRATAVHPTVHDDAQVTSVSQLFGMPGDRAGIVPADRVVPIEKAAAQLKPLWEDVRDTKSPNGLWQAVAAFARAAAHFQCYWDQAWVESMVLRAYAEGGHGYTSLDAGDMRAIESAYALQAQARADGDLDEGWAASPPLEAAFIPPPADDAVEALLAEMLTPTQLRERPPQPYLIKGVLNMASESWLIGPAGSKKSFVALDMAAHVAEGRDWQGRKVRQGPVVIIAAEGAGGLGARVKAWELEHGRPMPDTVHVLPRPVQAANATAWAVLVEACRRLAPHLVIADTQARVTVGLKENDATDMGIFIDAVGAVKAATGACVMPIHHTGRTGGDARGSSALDGAQDTELTITAGREPLTGQLRMTKQKDLMEGEPIPLRFALHTVGVDEDGDPVTSLALRRADAWRAAEDGQQPIELAEDWALNWPRVQEQILTVLVDQGGEIGITKAEARTNVAGRWYGGKITRNKEKDPTALHYSTFDTAWSKVREARAASGDPIVSNSEGEKWVVDPIARRAWKAEHDGDGE